jgi:DNA-binding transcriptional MerR regulator
MPEVSAQVEIPNRALFKAAEVCELAKVQPYVLRSWEAEFPELGVAKAAGAPRVYRRTDVEQVLRIRHLLLVEGLTLAGARRRLGEESAPVVAESMPIDELVGQNARERLTAVKRGLQSILELLSSGGTTEFRLAPPSATGHSPSSRPRSVPAERAKPARGKAATSRHAPPRSPQARRNRSA